MRLNGNFLETTRANAYWTSCMMSQDDEPTDLATRRELQWSSRDPTMILLPQLSSWSLSSEKVSNVTQCTIVKVRRLACFKKLLVKRHFRVKIDAKIFCWWLKLDRWTGNWNRCNGFSQDFEGLGPLGRSNVFILGCIEPVLPLLSQLAIIRSQLWTESL